MMHRIPAPAVLASAVLSGLFVLLHVFHPWTSWSGREWTRRPILLLHLYFVAVAIASFLWLWPRTASHLALQLLLEFSWLNGLSGQVFVLWGICPQDYRLIVLVASAIAVSVQAVGFALLQSREYRETGRGFTVAGALIFQVIAAIAVNCLHILLRDRHLRVIAFTVIFTLAALGIVANQIGFRDDNWFFLVNNIVECVVNLFIIVLRLFHRFVGTTDSRSQGDVENAFSMHSVVESSKTSVSERNPVPHTADPWERSIPGTPSSSSSSSSNPYANAWRRAIEEDGIVRFHYVIQVRALGEGVSALSLVELDTQKDMKVLRLGKVDWQTLCKHEEQVKELLGEDAYVTAACFSSARVESEVPIFAGLDLDEVITCSNDVKTLLDGNDLILEGRLAT